MTSVSSPPAPPTTHRGCPSAKDSTVSMAPSTRLSVEDVPEVACGEPEVVVVEDEAAPPTDVDVDTLQVCAMSATPDCVAFSISTVSVCRQAGHRLPGVLVM